MFGRGRRKTYRRLDEDFEDALKLPFDPASDRYVIFSDVHMADRVNGIDDFSRNEMIYCHALQHYYDEGYGLILNGDVEEAWQARPKKIRGAYRDTAYAVERLFAEKGQRHHVRIWGNHDSIWMKPSKVKKHLWKVLGEGVRVWPGLRLGDHLFVSHGHQGDIFSDTYAIISRFTVRHGWSWLQRLFNVTNARAATNHFVRQRRDDLIYRWALEQGQVVFAGHTHRSMFGEIPETNQIIALLRQLEDEMPDHPSPFQVQATVEHLRQLVQRSEKKRQKRKGEVAVPCYFNSGSCVHQNGITGIELEGGEVRLVKWELEEEMTPNQLLKQKEGLLFSIERRLYQRARVEDIVEKTMQAARRNGSGRKGEKVEAAA
jgi:UDP-2,3-diacylglucosamine pyrophosphatase LpxH